METWGDISPKLMNRKAGTTNWRQTASLLYYIILSDSPESQERKGGTNSSRSPARQLAVVRPAVLPTTSPRLHALAWALLRHQSSLAGVNMPSRTDTHSRTWRQCVSRSILRTFSDLFSERSTYQYFRSYTFQVPIDSGTLPFVICFHNFGH